MYLKAEALKMLRGKQASRFFFGTELDPQCAALPGRTVPCLSTCCRVDSPTSPGRQINRHRAASERSWSLLIGCLAYLVYFGFFLLFCFFLWDVSCFLYKCTCKWRWISPWEQVKQVMSISLDPMMFGKYKQYNKISCYRGDEWLSYMCQC